MRRIGLGILLLALATFGLAAPAAAEPGDPDARFGACGTQLLATPGDSFGRTGFWTAQRHANGSVTFVSRDS